MSSGILSDSAIHDAVKSGVILIDPFTPDQLNPASYDLRLGDEVAVYKRWVRSYPLWMWMNGADAAPAQYEAEPQLAWPIDSKNPEHYEIARRKIGPEGIVLYPRVGYLMHTHERIGSDRYVSVVDGKSSLGRLFISVHQTAGFIDPSFFGQITLEVTVKHPVRVYAGMRFAQIRFHTMAGIVEKPYTVNGHYDGKGIEGSRAWMQFSKENTK